MSWSFGSSRTLTRLGYSSLSIDGHVASAYNSPIASPIGLGVRMHRRAAGGSGMPKRHALQGKRMTALQRQTNGDRDRLSATIHFLGDLLGNVIREQAGAAAFDLEERVRGLAKDLRAIELDRPNAAARIAALQADMQHLVAGLPADQMRDLIRSFSTYFALVNLSEQLQ